MTTFRRLAANDSRHEYKIVFMNERGTRALLLIHKATNRTVDFISLREPIKNKAIDPIWYNHIIIFKDSNPVEHPLKDLPKLLKQQEEHSISMMEFIIHHNDIMKEIKVNLLQLLTISN